MLGTVLSPSQLCQATQLRRGLRAEARPPAPGPGTPGVCTAARAHSPLGMTQQHRSSSPPQGRPAPDTVGGTSPSPAPATAWKRDTCVPTPRWGNPTEPGPEASPGEVGARLCVPGGRPEGREQVSCPTVTQRTPSALAEPEGTDRQSPYQPHRVCQRVLGFEPAGSSGSAEHGAVQRGTAERCQSWSRERSLRARRLGSSAGSGSL